MKLEHRLSGYNLQKPTATCLADAVGNTVDRAEAVINLLQGQFETDSGQTLRNGLIFDSLESVRLDLADIKAVIEHYHETQKQGE